jgi:hypothetical protein
LKGTVRICRRPVLLVKVSDETHPFSQEQFDRLSQTLSNRKAGTDFIVSQGVNVEVLLLHRVWANPFYSKDFAAFWLLCEREWAEQFKKEAFYDPCGSCSMDCDGCIDRKECLGQGEDDFESFGDEQEFFP